MAEKTDKKTDLRSRILKSARALIETRGLQGLKARDVAEDAGAALGSLYTVFADLDALIMTVNFDSFTELDAIMRDAASAAATPQEKLANLVWAYLKFARENPMLWRAMFEHRLAGDKVFPAEHAAALMNLMQHIAKPLRHINPALSEADRLTRARTLFSAFHGVIATSLDGRFTGLTDKELEGELRALLGLLFGTIGRP